MGSLDFKLNNNMKKMLLKFSDSLLSREQTKGIKGGTTYCRCNGQLVGIASNNGNTNLCAQMSSPPFYVCSGGDGGGY